MNPVTLVSGFIPLVLFSLLDGRISVADAAAIGAATALVVAAIMVRRGIPVLPIVQAVTLGVWTSRRFIDLNRRISTAWGVAVLVLGLCRMATAAVATSSLPRFQAHLIEWGPAIVAVILALRYTQRTVAEARTGPAAAPQPTREY